MKTLKQRNQIYDKAKFVFGWDKQQDMVAEECSELIKAVMKLKRSDTPENRKALIDEIADVEIMLEQLKNVYTTQKDVDLIKEFKVVRLEERIHKNKISPTVAPCKNHGGYCAIINGNPDKNGYCVSCGGRVKPF